MAFGYNMVPMEQVRLLEAWRNCLFEELSISEIMGISKKRTKPWVFNSLKELAKNKLLTVRRKANINLYRLNLENSLLIPALQYLEAEGLSNFLWLDAISEIISAIRIRNYCLLAYGDDKKNLQLCFLVENKDDEGSIKSCLERTKSKRIEECYITFDDFIRMLLEREDNTAKRIVRGHKIFFNADIYYQLVKEAYRSGFRC